MSRLQQVSRLLISALLADIGLLAAMALPAHANLLTNGSFEAPPGFFQGIQGITPPSWNVTTQTPDLFSSDGSFGLASINNFAGIAAQHGLGWVAGWSGHPESFGQQLATMLTPNEPYSFQGYLMQARRVDLDYRGGYDTLLNSANSLAVVVATLDATTDSNDWEFRSETFTAPANSGDLPWIIFRPYTAGPAHSYPGLDNASLTGQVPPGVAIFDVVTPTASGPPYPAQPIIANVATRLGPTPPPIVPLPMDVSAVAAADGTGIDVGFRLLPLPPPILPAESFFDVLPGAGGPSRFGRGPGAAAHAAADRSPQPD